jgi:hypothetical protein
MMLFRSILALAVRISTHGDESLTFFENLTFPLLRKHGEFVNGTEMELLSIEVEW